METAMALVKLSIRKVLIVPCGMETTDKIYFWVFLSVLIVPYGMETPFIVRQIEKEESINCTLRNGNVIVIIHI